ncbi:MAG: hypothetical protein IPJ40_11840 [Saprospirales bacterium]|nr:hypothetical protein [Saprospirales bacterium]
MKKNLAFLLMLLGSSFWVTSVYAQHDNLANVSADYMRTGGRTAALDAADIAVYNPAGLVHLDDGFHINVGNQSFIRKPTHKFAFPIPGFNAEKEYQQDSPDLLVPNIYLAYKMNKLAVFGGFYISGGGGSLDYPNGSINSNLIILQLMTTPIPGLGAAYSSYYAGANSSILASSFYMTPMLGLSYGITDKLSAAVSFKYILATNKQEAHVTVTDMYAQPPVQLPTEFSLESTDKASGFGFTGSLDYKFSDNFNLAARYETNSSLEFETAVTTDDFGILQDGALNHRDLPASLSVGAGFHLTKNLSALLDFGWYFQKQADWGVEPKSGTEWSTAAGDVGRVAIGLGYDIGNLLTVNGWWNYTKYNYDDMSLYYTKLGVFETVKASNWSAGLGGRLNLGDRFNLNLAVVRTFWKKDDVVPQSIVTPLGALPYDVTINNSITSFALGLNYPA